MQLYEHQKAILDKNPAKCLLCWGTGTGKSKAAIELSRRDVKGSFKLFIVPKSLKEKWKRDLETVDYPLLYTKEEFRKQWNDIPYAPIIVVDEAHYFSGMKSQMTKSLLAYIKKHDPKYIYLLTATPYLSTPWNIYVLARILGHKWNYIEFKEKFFQDRYIGRRVVPEVRPGIVDELAKLVARIGDIVKLDDCADIPEQLFETEFFVLNKEQELAKKDIVEVNPIVRYTKYHQIENGTLKSDGYSEDITIKNDKLDRIIDICQENPKVAIVCRYNLQIDMYHKALGAAFPNRPLYIIRGDTVDRDAVVQSANASENGIVLINAACSEGYELPSIGIILFASMSFSYKDYAQMLGRFLRINKLKRNVYIHLITAGGIDEGVYESIKKKEDFDISIYNINN